MSELIIVENLNAVELFSQKRLDDVLEKIEKEVKSHVLDISSDSGRKFIASLAYKIAKSKTALDELGKNLTEEWKQKSKLVDSERKRMRDRLDDLKDEIRKPLTDWENAEKQRVSTHETNIQEIVNAGKYTIENWQTINIVAAQERAEEIRNDNCDWEEFAQRAEIAKNSSISLITEAITRRQKYEAEQAELKRLREAEQERAQKERELQIASEAAAKAKAEAEAKAKTEREIAERKIKEAEQAATMAQKKAKEEIERAIKAERDKLELQKKSEAEAAAKREADLVNRKKIDDCIIAAFIDIGFAGEQAIMALNAIRSKSIPYITITY